MAYIWGPRWPVKTETLVGCIYSLPVSESIARAFSQMRNHAKGNLYVRDGYMIPDEEQLDLCLLCGALHADFCVTRDEMFMARAEDMAASLEKWSKRCATTGKACIIRDDGGLGLQEWLYFAFRTSRRMFDQHCVIFAVLEKGALGRDVAFESRPISSDIIRHVEHTFTCLEPWGLARRFAKDGANRLLAQRVVIRNTEICSMIFGVSRSWGKFTLRFPYLKLLQRDLRPSQNCPM